MSTSGELVRELIGMGMSRRAIGQAIGRNDRLIGYVEKGQKPGENLRDSLTELRDKLAQGVRVEHVSTAPARRTTTRGTLAGIRKPATVHGNRWQSTTLKRQATRSGAKGLMHPIGDAADAGRTVAVTIGVDKGTHVRGSYGKHGRAGAGGTIEMNLGDAGELAELIASEYGGNVADYLADEAASRGFITSDVGAGHFTSVELRAW